MNSRRNRVCKDDFGVSLAAEAQSRGPKIYKSTVLAFLIEEEHTWGRRCASRAGNRRARMGNGKIADHRRIKAMRGIFQTHSRGTRAVR